MKKSISVIGYLIFSTAAILISIGFVFFFIIKNGIQTLTYEFITASPKGFGVSGGGIFPAIAGTFLLGGISIVSALIASLAVSFSICLLIKHKHVKQCLRMLVTSLAAVPSVVLGLFGYALFVKSMGMGKSLLAGALTLGIMIFPFLEQRIEKAINSINPLLIQSAYALGFSYQYIIIHIILPIIKADMLRSAALAVSFAMGATAPIILTAAVLIAPVPQQITDPVMALPYHLYILANEGIDHAAAYGTALVLLGMLLIINLGTIVFIKGTPVYD